MRGRDQRITALEGGKNLRAHDGAGAHRPAVDRRRHQRRGRQARARAHVEVLPARSQQRDKHGSDIRVRSQHVERDGVLSPRQRQVGNLRAEFFQHEQSTFECRAYFGVHAVGPRHFMHHCELDPLQVAAERARVVRHGALAGQVVARIMTRDRGQENRVVLDRARNRADGVGRPAVHHAAVAAHPPEGRPQADDAVGRRRAAHGATGILAQRSRAQSRGRRDSGTARGTAGIACRVPRIARLAVEENVGAAFSEFVQIFLADQDRAGGIHARDHGGIEIGYVVGHDLRADGGADAARAKLVLHPIGDTVQRALVVAARNFALNLPRACERLLRTDRDVRAQHAIVALDAVQAGLDEFHRRDLPVTDQSPLLGNAQECQFFA